MDFKGILNAKVRNLIETNKRIGSFLITRMLCALKGIAIGKSCLITGVPYLYRCPNSQIVIGNSVTIRSDFTTNMIGINRRTLIATHAERASITIGDHAGLSGTVIGAYEKVEIGRNVLCGANTLITDFDWHVINQKKRESSEEPLHAPVKIEDNVWLGINVIVLKGVTIGQGSVIGANSLVIHDIPPEVVAAGNPCKIIRTIDACIS